MAPLPASFRFTQLNTMNTSTTEIKKTASLVRSLAQGRAAVWILASCLVLFGALDNPATAASAPARTPNDAPEGLSAGDWSSIRAARDAAQLAIQPNAQGYGARNPRQQWRTQFDQQGFLTHPDKASGAGGSSCIATASPAMSGWWNQPTAAEWKGTECATIEERA